VKKWKQVPDDDQEVIIDTVSKRLAEKHWSELLEDIRQSQKDF
jgi:hypothetical protein